jgi:hypothetical protein
MERRPTVVEAMTGALGVFLKGCRLALALPFADCAGWKSAVVGDAKPPAVEVTRTLGKMWRAMPDSEKEVIDTRAACL